MGDKLEQSVGGEGYKIFGLPNDLVFDVREKPWAEPLVNQAERHPWAQAKNHLMPVIVNRDPDN